MSILNAAVGGAQTDSQREISFFTRLQFVCKYGSGGRTQTHSTHFKREISSRAPELGPQIAFWRAQYTHRVNTNKVTNLKGPPQNSSGNCASAPPFRPKLAPVAPRGACLQLRRRRESHANSIETAWFSRYFQPPVLKNAVGGRDALRRSMGT